MRQALKNVLTKGLYIIIVTLLLSECTTSQRNKKQKTAQNPETEKASELAQLKYPIVETGQTKFYDKDGNVIDPPTEGERFYGQDAQYGGLEFSFTDNEDGTVTDNNTGLMWQQIPDESMVSFSGAAEYCDNLEFAGYDDWRIPSTKELFSLTNFEPKKGEPCLDTNYFKFPPKSERPMGRPMNGGSQSRPQGGPPSGEKPADEGSANYMPPPSHREEGRIGKDQGQFWTSDFYKVGTTHGGGRNRFWCKPCFGTY